MEPDTIQLLVLVEDSEILSREFNSEFTSGIWDIFGNIIGPLNRFVFSSSHWQRALQVVMKVKKFHGPAFVESSLASSISCALYIGQVGTDRSPQLKGFPAIVISISRKYEIMIIQYQS